MAASEKKKVFFLQHDPDCFRMSDVECITLDNSEDEDRGVKEKLRKEMIR